MRVHAIQTGCVRIKNAQVEGRGHGITRQIAMFTDQTWTDWLPTYAWAIEHPEGVIVIDTGQGAHLLKSGQSLHPYVRWNAAFQIEPEQEIGPQLRALGIGQRDVKKVVLTHLHMDHDPSWTEPAARRGPGASRRPATAICAAFWSWAPPR